jgi:aminopeptidase N
VFRAIVYNKGALVLHMLRRLIGDEMFFRGLRRFYAAARFRKAGTPELRAAFEAEAGRSLERFFARWIFESGVPRLTFDTRVETSGDGPGVLVVRFEQSERVFDLPVTVTIAYADRPPEDVVVAVTDRVVEMRVPLKDEVRSIGVNRDFAALAEIDD